MSRRLANLLTVALVLAGAAAWAAAPEVLGLPDQLALLVGIASAVALQAARLVRERRRRRRHLVSCSTGVYRLSARFDPVRSLGLHRSARAEREVARGYAADGAGALPPYVHGAIDGAIDRLLGESSFVLLVGNSLSGKSRAAYEAVRRRFAGAEIWTPAGPEGLRALLEGDPPLPAGGRDVVVWLDDLNYFLKAADGSRGEPLQPVTHALLARHLSRPRGWFASVRPRLVFVATMSRRQYDVLTEPSDDGGTFRRGAEIVRLADRLELADGRAAGWDMKEAVRLYPGVDFSRGIGRALAEGEEMIRVYRRGADAVGRALVRAAIDWWRIGVGWPSAGELRSLLPATLPDAVVTAARFDEGLLWANREIAGGQRLLYERQRDGGVAYEAHPYLVDADEGYGEDAEARSVSEGIWRAAFEMLDFAALFAVAESAHERDEGRSEQIMRRLADDPDVAGSSPDTRARADLVLGRMHRGQRGREAEAEARLTAALASGEPDVRAEAYLLRGSLREEQPGREGEAEADFTAAVEIEDADGETTASAYYERGLLRLASDRGAAALDDYTAAIETGGAEPFTLAWAHLQRALLEREHGRTAQARADLTATIGLRADPDSVAHAYGVRASIEEDPERRLPDLNAAVAVEGAAPGIRAAALFRRAQTLVELERNHEAMEDFSTALEAGLLTPEARASAHLTRALFWGEEGDPAAEEAEYDRVIEIGDAPEWMRGMAHLYRARLRLDRDGKEWKAATVADLTAAIELGSGEVRGEGHYLRGNLWFDNVVDEKEALADFTAATETEGATPHSVCSSYIHRGRVHSSLGHDREAERDFGRGIEVPNGTPRSLAVGYANRGLLRQEQKRFGEAEADLRAAVSLPGEDVSAGALVDLADLLRAIGRGDEEPGLYREAVKSRRPELVAVGLPRLETLGGRSARFARRRRRRLRRGQGAEAPG